MTERIELKNFSSKGEALLPSYSLPPQAKSPSETSSQNIKNEYLGMFFACIAVFCRANASQNSFRKPTLTISTLSPFFSSALL